MYGKSWSKWRKVALGKGKVIKDMTKAELDKSLLGYQNGNLWWS
jgi:hypothetical protein